MRYFIDWWENRVVRNECWVEAESEDEAWEKIKNRQYDDEVCSSTTKDITDRGIVRIEEEQQ